MVCRDEPADTTVSTLTIKSEGPLQEKKEGEDKHAAMHFRPKGFGALIYGWRKKSAVPYGKELGQ